MRILLMGGSGFLGTILLPYLRKENWVRVLDLADPKAPCDDFVRGSVLDAKVVSQAMNGVDRLLYFAMGRSHDNSHDEIGAAQDINVKGLHLALDAALKAGVKVAAYPSTLSIYENYMASYLTSEADCPGDSSATYGFTKWLGEGVCRYFGQRRGMRVTALRLCGPMANERWLQVVKEHGYTLCTAASDVAAAMLCALRLEGPGYDCFFTTGDYEERQVNQKRAKDVLGWEPKVRPQ